jgi:hypothetical protein
MQTGPSLLTVFKKRTGDTKGCGKLAVLINQARLLWLL